MYALKLSYNNYRHCVSCLDKYDYYFTFLIFLYNKCNICLSIKVTIFACINYKEKSLNMLQLAIKVKQDTNYEIVFCSINEESVRFIN